MPVQLEAWVLPHEVEKAILALFEINAVPVPDEVIGRIQRHVLGHCHRLMCVREAHLPMRLRGFYEPDRKLLLLGLQFPKPIGFRTAVEVTDGRACYFPFPELGTLEASHGRMA